jgi:hypothetical protein
MTLDPLISRFVALLALIRKSTAVTCFSGTSDPNPIAFCHPETGARLIYELA